MPGLRINIVRYSNDEYRVFGDTKGVKGTLSRCRAIKAPHLQHPTTRKYSYGWKIDVAYVQYLIMQLEKEFIKVYLNGK